jgi:restriction system protein
VAQHSNRSNGARAAAKLAAMAPVTVPAYSDLLWPTLSAVRTLGGSGSIDEIVEVVLKQEDFSDEQQQVLHGDGPQTEIEYRLAWARTYLKFMGLLVNSSRGGWSLTDLGRSVSEGEIAGLHAQALAAMREKQRAKQRNRGAKPEGEDADAASEELDWRDELLEALMAMPPDGFERLAQRLLREAGFISATVTGRTGYGGIDGLGVYRMSLVSFPVFFQCKRYRGSVGAGAVRDFRGAMPVVVTRAYSSPPAPSLARRRQRRPGTAPRPSTSSTGSGCATCSSSTTSAPGPQPGWWRTSSLTTTSSRTCDGLRRCDALLTGSPPLAIRPGLPPKRGAGGRAHESTTVPCRGRSRRHHEQRTMPPVRYKIVLRRVQTAERIVRAADNVAAAEKVQAELDRPYGFLGTWQTVDTAMDIVEAERPLDGPPPQLGGRSGSLLLSVKAAAAQLNVPPGKIPAGEQRRNRPRPDRHQALRQPGPAHRIRRRPQPHRVPAEAVTLGDRQAEDRLGRRSVEWRCASPASSRRGGRSCDPSGCPWGTCSAGEHPRQVGLAKQLGDARRLQVLEGGSVVVHNRWVE